MSGSRYTRGEEVAPFVTKDGSLIRELMHPSQHASTTQSLAEATVTAFAATTLHRHHESEELYYILGGHGMMTLGAEVFAVHPGDTVCISPGVAHRIQNIGDTPLRILCCCSPPYADADTELLVA